MKHTFPGRALGHLMPPSPRNRCGVGEECPYLLVVKLAVLEVPHRGQRPHAGVCIVVRVLTHTVGETLLEGQFTR